MVYSSPDLTQVETAIIRLASGSSVVRGTIGDKTVEFQGQDWRNPRVIGFRNNPKPCCMIYETFAGDQFKYGEWSVVANWNPADNPEYYFSDETLHFFTSFG